MSEEKDFQCPNCGTPAKGVAGGKIVCVKCGGTFRFEAGEARLNGVVDLDKLQADVEELKQRLPASSPAAEPPADPDESEELLDDDDDEDL
jgi:uncharacterized Zn finger protein (UPF0148 family)